MENVFTRKNTTQLAHVELDLSECNGFTLENGLSYASEYINNECNNLRRILRETVEKVNEYENSGVEKSKIKELAHGAVSRTWIKIKELYNWFIKQLQAFSKLLSSTASNVANKVMETIKKYRENRAIDIEIIWYNDEDVKELLDNSMIRKCMPYFTKDVDQTLSKAHDTTKEMENYITKIKYIAQNNKRRMRSSQSRYYRSTIACADTVNQINQCVKNITNLIERYVNKAISTINTFYMRSVTDFDRTELITEFKSELQHCITLLNSRKDTILLLLKLAYENSNRVNEFLSSKVNQMQSQKSTINNEYALYNITNFFNTSHINEYGEVSLSTL